MKKNKISKKTKPVITEPVPLVYSVPAEVESVPLTADEANQLTSYDQQLANGKMQLANLELQLSDLQAQKSELIRVFKEVQAKFLSDVNKMATDHGIELDASKDSRRWNLDTNAMVFQLLK